MEPRGSRVSVVGIATGCGAGRPTGWSSSPGGGKNFHFSSSSRPALGSTQPPIQWVPRPLSPGVTRPRREANRSPPTGAEVKKMWIYTGTTLPLLYGPQRFITVSRAYHWSLSWARSIQYIPPHSVTVIFVLILSSHIRQGLRRRLFASNFPTKTLYAFRFAPCVLRALLSIPDLIIWLHLVKSKSYEAPLYALLSDIVIWSLFSPNILSA
jgi:hypothetical protein